MNLPKTKKKKPLSQPEPHVISRLIKVFYVLLFIISADKTGKITILFQYFYLRTIQVQLISLRIKGIYPALMKPETEVSLPGFYRPFDYRPSFSQECKEGKYIRLFANSSHKQKREEKDKDYLHIWVCVIFKHIFLSLHCQYVSFDIYFNEIQTRLFILMKSR